MVRQPATSLGAASRKLTETDGQAERQTGGKVDRRTGGQMDLCIGRPKFFLSFCIKFSMLGDILADSLAVRVGEPTRMYLLIQSEASMLPQTLRQHQN